MKSSIPIAREDEKYNHDLFPGANGIDVAWANIYVV
jgi:hypothetical protein